MPATPPGLACAGYCPTLEIRSARPSFTPRRQRFPGEPGTGTAGPVRPVLPRSAGRPNSREEGSGAKTPRATGAPQYMTSHPASDLPASKAHDRDRPASYPGATGHRPPVDPRRHRAQGSPQRPRRRIRFCRKERVEREHSYALTGMFARGPEQTVRRELSDPVSRARYLGRLPSDPAHCLGRASYRSRSRAVVQLVRRVLKLSRVRAVVRRR